MRNLFSGRRRYALACLVAVGGLVTAAASCEPTKEPVKPPAPTGLSIEPTSYDFGDNTTTPQTFTVTNHGPDTTVPLDVSLSGGDPGSFDLPSVDNVCQDTTLAAGDSCTINVSFAPISAGLKQTELNVDSDDVPGPEAVATLTGNTV